MSVDGPTMIERQISSIGVRAMILVVIAALVMSLLYVLSVGPAVWLLQHGYMSDGFFAWLYAPVNYVYDRSQPAKELLDTYTAFWGSP
jgi:hypothetical protein